MGIWGCASRPEPMVSVRLDAMLKEFTPRTSLSCSADSVSRLIDVLEADYPRLRFRLRDETGEMRRFVKVFVNGDDIGGLNGLKTPLSDRDQVDILHSIAGG